MGGIFVKRPKTDQDLRFDMPVVGPKTVELACIAGLRGLVISPGSVMLLEKDQLLDFCGNAIELRNQDDEKFLIMSSRAREALHVSQEEFLLNHFKEIIHADLSTIELYGGGSARCMVTELM